MKTALKYRSLLPLLIATAVPITGLGAPRLSDYIRPFVGTQGEGNTYPGPSAPFGMVQLGPDTDRDLWATASGYEYSDSSISTPPVDFGCRKAMRFPSAPTRGCSSMSTIPAAFALARVASRSST